MKIQRRVLVQALFGCSLACGSVATASESVDRPLRTVQTIHLGSPRGAGDPVLYDSTGGGFAATTRTPRTFIGGAANLIGAGPQVDITRIKVYMVSFAAVHYTNIRGRVQFWDIYSSSSSPVFARPAGSVVAFDLGPLDAEAATVYGIDVDLGSPVRLNNVSGEGFAISFQGDTGTGLALTDDLSPALVFDAPLTVGSSAIPNGNGFYQNVSGQTTFNFDASDLRVFADHTDTRPALILGGNGSVPVMLQSFEVR